MGRDPFEQLVVNQRHYLLRYAMTLCHRRDQAQDLVQETILRALTHRDHFQDGSNLAAWLNTILRNTYFTIIRNGAREEEWDDMLAETRAAPTPSPDQYLAKRDLQILFEKIEEERHPLLLALARGERYDEIAKRFGVPEGTIKSRVSRLRADARAIITGHDSKPKHYRLNRWLAKKRPLDRICAAAKKVAEL